MKTEVVSVFVKIEGHGHVSGAIGCAVPSGIAPVFSAAGWTELASSPPWSIEYAPEGIPLPDPGDFVELRIEVPTKKATEQLLEQYRDKIAEFDGFVSKGGQLSGSGEIRVAPETLEKVFGYSNLRLQTDDGQSLSFRFSGKELQSPRDAAHVVLTGTLPPISKWRH